DGAGLQGGGELLVEVLVAAHRFGDRDDLVLGLVELGEQGREHLVVLAGEGGPEQDRGAVLVLGGHGEIGLGEAVADGALGIAAPAGGAAGGEAGRAGAEPQGGEQAATGGGEGAVGHVGGSVGGCGIVHGRGCGAGPTGRRGRGLTSWRRRRGRR